MKTIWKYELVTDCKNVLQIPVGGKILSLQTRREIPCIWILVDIEEAFEIRTFYFYGTGQVISGMERLTYIGTSSLQDGSLVFHLFEERN